MKVWAIRHKPTGGYLPRGEFRTIKGGSLVEPTLDKPPRLFQSFRAAKSALGHWLRGKYVSKSYIDFPTGEYEYQLNVIPQPHRKREEMEIVEFNLVEVKP